MSSLNFEALDERNLIVLSYRRAQIKNGASSGGLVVSLSALFNEESKTGAYKNVIVAGFDGEPTEQPDNNLYIEDVPGRPSLKSAMLRQTTDELEKVYKGYCSVIWAIRHGMTELINPEAIKYYREYRAMNRRVAEIIFPHLKPNDVIKIEDYQLETVALELRALGCENRISHFSHIPEERMEDFDALPAHIRHTLQEHKNSLNIAKLSCDLIGFQTARDLENFKLHTNLSGDIPAQYDVQRLNIAGRTIKLGYFPASIDTYGDRKIALQPMTSEEKMAFDPNGQINAQALRVMLGGRADPSKKVPALYDDVNAILSDAAFYRDAQYIQKTNDVPLHAYGIATETRKGTYGYDEELVAIRAAHANLTATHIAANGYKSGILNEKGLPRDTLLKAYSNAIGFFPSKRDGQLLGVFEHQVAQQATNPYPVIVSKEAGAADNMPGGIIIDPFNPQERQAALKQAVLMSPEEKQSRWKANMSSLKVHTSGHQLENFIGHLTNNLN